MSGIKIINVLKDDSLAEILELFRKAPAGEVIFVLPKQSKVFRAEDHFAAFAAEAEQGEKVISIMTGNATVAELAHKYSFSVMNAPARGASAKKPKKKVTAKLASMPADDDIQDTNADAFQDPSDVVTTSDEQPLGRMNPETLGSDTENLDGFHVEGDDGKPVDDNEDGATDKPTQGDFAYGEADLIAATPQGVTATLASAPATKSAAPKVLPSEDSLDYIDAVWRQRAAQQADTVGHTTVAAAPQSSTSARRVLPTVSRHFFRTASKPVALGILVAAVLIAGTGLMLIPTTAAIVITPTAKPLNVSIVVQASDTFTSIDGAFNKLPGQLIDATKTATVVRPGTGQREVASKARGKIIISNAYSPTPQTLVQQTRFMAPNGLIFRTMQSVNVPGSTTKNGAAVPGTITVDVVADKPGTEYNVAAGKWVVAAFKERGDTERVEKIYGTSEQAMSGGASGPSTVITQADYDAALAEATADATKQLTDAVAAQGTDLVVLGADHPTMGTPKTTAQVDDAAEEVQVTVSATLKTVAFRKADLVQLIKDAVLRGERLVVVPEELNMEYSNIQYRSDLGVLVFTVNLTGEGYIPVEQSAIIEGVKGAHAATARSFFSGREGVAAASVTIRPPLPWVRSLPTQASRIKVQVNYGITPIPTK